MMTSVGIIGRQFIVALFLVLSTTASSSQVPQLMTYSPLDAEIPANTLRFYLTFSSSIARGQIREKIRLVNEDGSPVKSPFLNLGIELWDSDQRRLTLLFDPGRVKQAVGPNIQSGPPLVEGNSYRLIIRGTLKGASGGSLGRNQIIAFRAVAPERRVIAPNEWMLKLPKANSIQPFKIKFDRIMDNVLAARLIRVVGPGGGAIIGNLDSRERSWTLMPFTAWPRGKYRLRISLDLEDIAGNTIRAAFDARPGIKTQNLKVMERTFILG